MNNSIIIDRTIVTANQFQKQVIDKMYSPAVYQDTTVERITYLSDDLKVKGYVVTPNKEGTFPVILWNRGGYKDNGALEDLTAFLILASIAQNGYIVVASQYRGNMGSEGSEDWGGGDVNDALNMLHVAELLPQADLSKVAIEGASRGGMTTYRILAQDHRFKCAVVHAGLADIFEMERYDERFAKLVDLLTSEMTVEEKQVKLASISGQYLAKQFSPDCPILLLHGDADATVPISQTENMALELNQLSLPHEFITINSGGHVALKDGSYIKIDELRLDFLKKYLG